MVNLVLFNPYIGDTFMASAFCRKLEEENLTILANIGGDMLYLGSLFNTSIYYSEELRDFLELGKVFDNAPLITKYKGGEFLYEFEPDQIFVEKLTILVSGILQQFNQESTKIFILNYTYPFALLGKLAQEAGFSVNGYVLEDEGLKMIDYEGNKVNAIIWTEESIIERLGRLFLGKVINKNDFNIKVEKGKIDNKKVTLFPTTRGNTSNKVEHWNLDIEYLYNKGYNVNVAWYKSETTPKISNMNKANGIIYKNINDMILEIIDSDLIICYDSASFHFAWYYNIPAIVKLKGGFNLEWFPSWVRNNKKYPTISSEFVYSEEYIQKLDLAYQTIKG